MNRLGKGQPPRSVAASWRTIEAALAKDAPHLVQALRAPAPPRTLESLERRVGHRLPNDLRESLSVHDGMRDSYLGNNRLFDYQALLGVQEIAAASQAMTSLADTEAFRHGDPSTRTRKVKNDRWWNSAWIPITDADGDKYVVDLDPGPSGRIGQVFYFYNSGGSPRTVRAISYREWLDALASAFESGEYYVEDGGISLRKRI
jgi:cell wall assembly regulator SMI1